MAKKVIKYTEPPGPTELDLRLQKLEEKDAAAGIGFDRKKADQLGAGLEGKSESLHEFYPQKEANWADPYKDYIAEGTLKGGQYDIETLNTLRAENQSNWEQAGNAFGRVAVNIVPQIAGGFASMVDIPGYFDAEEAANNSIVNWAADVKKEVDNDWFPIYEEKPQAMNVSDPAWWMSRGSGLVESIGSFLAQGAGVGKAVSLAGKGIGALTMGKRLYGALETIPGVVSGANVATRIGQGTRGLTAATMLNQSEAVIEATQVFKDTYEDRLNKKYSQAEAKKAAAEAAATTMNLNRMNILLNLSSASAFLTPFKTTRQLLTQGGKAAALGKIAGEMGQESAEELINHVASKAGMAKGKNEKYTFENALKDMGSMEGFEAAFLGAIGGMAQTGGTELYNLSKYSGGKDEQGNRISKREVEKNRYDAQQEVINDLKSKGVKINESLKDIKDLALFHEELDKAVATGDQEKYNSLKDQQFATQALKAFESGTTEVLENLYEAEAARPVEEVGQEYIDNAKQAAKNLLELERIYNNYEGYANVDDIFFNRANKMRNDRVLNYIKDSEKVNSVELGEQVRRIAKKYSFNKEQDVLYKENGELVRTEKRTTEVPLSYNMQNLEENQGDTEENKKVYDEFLKEVQSLPAYQRQVEYNETLDRLENISDGLEKQLGEFTSKEYQAKVTELKAKQKELADAKSNLPKINSIQELNSLKEKFDNEDFKTAVDARIKEIEDAKSAELNQKKVNLEKQKIVEKLKVSKLEDLDNIREEINNLEIDKTQKDELLNRVNDRASQLNGDDPIEDPLANFTQGKEEEEEVENENKAFDTTIPNDIPNSATESKDVEEQVADAVKVTAEDTTYPAETDTDGNKIYNYFRSKFGAIRAAFLSREFNQKSESGIIDREEVTDNIDNLQVLDPEVLTPGTKIKLRVKTDYVGEKYDPTSNTREKVLWSAREQELFDKYGDNYRQSQEYIDEVPIVAIGPDGNEVFFVHDVAWIRGENIDNTPENIFKDKQTLREIRKAVIAKGEVETEITYKSNGRLIKTVNGKAIPVTEAMPDEKLPIALYQDGVFNGVTGKPILNADKGQQGRIYAVVPINNKETIAIALEKTNLNDQAVTSIIKAIEVYLEGDENNPIVQEVANTTGLDLTNITGLRNYIARFTHLVKTEGNEGLDGLLSRKTDKLQSNQYLMSISGNAIQFGRPKVNAPVKSVDNKIKKAAVISKNFEGTERGKASNRAALLALEAHLKNMFSNADKEALLTNGAIAFIDQEGNVTSQDYKSFVKETHKTNILSVNIGTEASPKFVYTIQPTILFADDFVSTTVKKEIKEPITTEEEVEKQVLQNNEEAQALELAAGMTLAELQGFLQNIQESVEIPGIEDTAEAIRIFTRAIEIKNQTKIIDDNFNNENIIITDTDLAEESEDSWDYDDDEMFPDLSKEQIDEQRADVESLIIRGLDPRTQESFISYLALEINRASLDAKEKTGNATIDTRAIFNNRKELIEKLAKTYEDKGLVNKAKKFKLILEQWPKVQSLTKQHLSLLNTGTVSEEYNAEDANEAGLERTSYNDDFTFTVNSKSTASADLRKFFSFTQAVDSAGELKYNSLGFPDILPFDVVYDTLHEILANKPADYNTMMKFLDIYQEAFPWISQIKKSLEAAPDKIKNEFVSDMAKRSLDMEFVMWTKDRNGNYTLQNWSSNSSAIENRLRNIWNSNLKGAYTQSNLVTTNAEGEYVFDQTVAEGLIEQGEEWKQNPPSKDADGIAALSRWLGNFGIVLSDRTYDDLIKGKFKNKSTLSWQGLFNKSNGLVNILTTELSRKYDVSTVDDAELLTDTVIKNLSKLEAKNTSNIFSNSFQAGTKTVYSYTNNNYLSNRVRDLVATDAEGNFLNQDLIDDLQSISFTSESLWLKDLVDKGELGMLTRDTLKLTTLSLEALKKEFTQSQDNRKLNNLSAAEHELVKLGGFFNNSKNLIAGSNRRMVSFFYPTMSDKSTMVKIRALAREFKSENNTISDEGVEILYNAIILPELHRMTGKHAENIKGYKPDYFYFLPNLNIEEVTIGDTTKTFRDFVLDGKAFTPEFKQELLKEVKKTFETLVENKLEDWNKLGIGVTNSETKDIHSFLDKSYMANVAKGVGKGKVRYAAQDYVFNYLISNAEAFKLFAGDPALYYKASSKENATIMDHMEETFINLGKRLAGDIAPGLELANSTKNKYYQLFFADKKIDSNNVKDKTTQEYFSKIMKDFKKNYSGIEGSDAQEYTTWQEHLYVLNNLGRITDRQYNTIKSKLENNERLEFSELNLVLQPLKPVYVGNIADVDNNVDRRVYIKSSSFPLIPQLTAGMELDKVRVAMEDFQNKYKNSSSDGSPITVRASFGTANKVGAVANPINIFDDNGDVLDKIAISESQALLLPRTNFRIQQDVPYNREKDETNIGTQERKLLFVNMLDVEISKGVTGTDLQRQYDQAYENLFKYKYEKLMENLGLLETEINGNFSNLYEVSAESSIFDRIKERDAQIDKATNPISKKAIKVGFETAEGELEAQRADYINKNFDRIVEAFANNDVESFFDDKTDFEKQCE